MRFLSIAPMTRLASGALDKVVGAAARTENLALSLQYRLGARGGRSMSPEASELVARHPGVYLPSPDTAFAPERSKEIARVLEGRGITG